MLREVSLRSFSCGLQSQIAEVRRKDGKFGDALRHVYQQLEVYMSDRVTAPPHHSCSDFDSVEYFQTSPVGGTRYKVHPAAEALGRLGNGHGPFSHLSSTFNF